MLETALGFEGGFTAPHRAAALAGRDVLRTGGTAIEAMVAAAAVIAVVYPHMNGLGGDAFWIVRPAGGKPVVLSGAGTAGRLATTEWYAKRGHRTIPFRGAEAVLTVPGAVATWQLALDEFDTRNGSGLGELLAPALALARDGVAVSSHLSACSRRKGVTLAHVPGFADVHLPLGAPLKTGGRFRQPALVATLERLATAGLDDFYRGAIADEHHAFLEREGSPLRGDDLNSYRAHREAPVSVSLNAGLVYNVAPPTQGFATLMALGIFDRLKVLEADGYDHLHGLIEAIKIAYRLRNRHLADPAAMTESFESWLTPGALQAAARSIARDKAHRGPSRRFQAIRSGWGQPTDTAPW